MALITRTLNAHCVSNKLNGICQALLKSDSISVSSTRNTYILRRRQDPPPGRLGRPNHYRLKARHYEYILEEDTNLKRLEHQKFVLKTYVEDVGQKGEIVTMHPLEAYERLILPGLADFGTPENLKKAEEFVRSEDDTKISSITAAEMKRILETHTILQVTMNQDNPWVLEPWHIRAACHLQGIMLGSNDCVEIPRKLEGPNLNWEGKEFYVIIKINNFERVTLRCRLHHWATSPFDRLPWESDFWTKTADPIFPEDAEILSKMPLPPPKRFIKNKWA